MQALHTEFDQNIDSRRYEAMLIGAPRVVTTSFAAEAIGFVWATKVMGVLAKEVRRSVAGHLRTRL